MSHLKNDEKEAIIKIKITAGRLRHSMKISTFLSQIDTAVTEGEIKSLDEGLSILSAQGLSMVDLWASSLESAHSPKELLATLKNHNIKVSSIFHPVEFDYENEKILERMREDTKRRMEDCASMETRLFMPVPITAKAHSSAAERLDCQKKVASYLNDVCEIAKPYHVTVVLENFSDLSSTFATVEDIDTLLNQVPQLFYVLDTGNFWFSDNDVYKACELFADKIRHVHLKDIIPSSDGYLTVNGKSCDSNELGSGIIDFDRIFEKLHSIHYDGAVTVEINSPGELMKKIELSLSYLKSRKVGLDICQL